MDPLKKKKKQLRRNCQNCGRNIGRIKAKAGKRARDAEHLLRIDLGKDKLVDTMPGITVKLLCDVRYIEWDARYLIPTLDIDADFVNQQK